jgi:hypothetical protein
VSREAPRHPEPGKINSLKALTASNPRSKKLVERGNPKTKPTMRIPEIKFSEPQTQYQHGEFDPGSG